VVVRDFDIVGMVLLPSEADPVLIIHPDAVLSRSLAAQSLQTIPRRDL
jgi:hypothetical protein